MEYNSNIYAELWNTIPIFTPENGVYFLKYLDMRSLPVMVIHPNSNPINP